MKWIVFALVFCLAVLCPMAWFALAAPAMDHTDSDIATDIGEAVADAAPEVAAGIAAGNWIGALIGIVGAVIGLFARRKTRRARKAIAIMGGVIRTASEANVLAYDVRAISKRSSIAVAGLIESVLESSGNKIKPPKTRPRSLSQ